MRIPKLLGILALTASWLPCQAQTEDKVSLQFLSFPRVAESQAVELLVGEGKTIEVQIPSNELSPSYSVPRAESWVVGKMEAGDDGKSKFRAFGKGKTLASNSQLLLLIRKGPRNTDGFKIIPVDNSTSHFGGGKFLFVNASRSDLAAAIGGTRFALKPGTKHIIAPKTGQGAELCRAELFYQKEAEWKPFFSSNWPLQKNARGLIFIYNDPVGGRLKLHTIRDFL